MALSAEDKIAIMELAARYNQAIDSGDGEGWAATFAEDGVFEFAQGEVTGRAQLVQYVEDGAERRQERSTRHWNNNMVIEGDGDAATLSCYLHLMSGAELAATGTYDDTLKKVDGVWKFARRRVAIDR